MKKRRGHLLCGPNGRYLIEPCGGRGQSFVAWQSRHGETLQPGQALVQITPTEDGHVEYEIVHREKPAQVATPGFRRGWEATFARDKSVN